MSLPLLQTKLYTPLSRPQRVHRDHLLVRLRDQARRPLTLVSAPAGFGKTTLVSDWIAQTNPAVAWLSLDEDDNDPPHFLSYVLAALQTQQPQLGITAQGLLNAPQPPAPKAILTLLLNDLGTLTAPLTLVLDDYHLITTPAIHEALTFLVDHLPPTFRLIITTRIDPPLPLARWRVRNQLAEVRADALRFSPQETATFLNDVMGLQLTSNAITTLTMRTEGWIAGLQLAALSLQGRADADGFIHAFSGSHRHVLSYLVEEVLNRQPADTLDFLLQTAVLERLTAPLCNAVTGRSDSQTLLQQIEQANLFLIPLDDESQWYRYHHLFAEVLHSRLQQVAPQMISPLHQRASAWYAGQALWSEAIRHALAAEDFAQSAALIEQVGIAHFAQTNIQQSLKRWLASLPVDLIRKRPRLCLIHVWLAFVHSDITAGLQWMAEAEAALQQSPESPANASIRGEMAALRAILAAYHPSPALDEAITWGQQALAALGPDQATFRSIAAGAMGSAYLKQDDVIRAEQAFAEATRMGRSAGSIYVFAAAVGNQAIMQRTQGALHPALFTYQQALAWVTEQGALAYPTIGSLYSGLADLLREQNDLASAQHYAETAITHHDQGVNPALLVLSRIVLLRVKQAQGDWEQAWALLREISSLVEQHPYVIQRSLLPAIRAQLQVAEGEFATDPNAAQKAAYAWAQNTAWEEGAAFSAYNAHDFIYMLEHSRIARAQVLIAWARRTGDQTLLPETFAYLTRQQRIAADGNLLWFQIKILLLQALTHHLLGAAEPARHALTQALELAQPEGFIRLFVDEGEPARLLIVDFGFWLAQQPATEQTAHWLLYTNKLLTNFGPEPSFSDESVRDAQPKIQNPKPALNAANVSQIQNLVEPLSTRELEVLQLVADGLSNTEIAAKLIVSTGTVKTHINHIFGKLAVESRMQAVVRARQLGLING